MAGFFFRSLKKKSNRNEAVEQAKNGNHFCAENIFFSIVFFSDLKSGTVFIKKSFVFLVVVVVAGHVNLLQNVCRIVATHRFFRCVIVERLPRPEIGLSSFHYLLWAVVFGLFVYMKVSIRLFAIKQDRNCGGRQLECDWSHISRAEMILTDDQTGRAHKRRNYVLEMKTMSESQFREEIHHYEWPFDEFYSLFPDPHHISCGFGNAPGHWGGGGTTMNIIILCSN